MYYYEWKGYARVSFNGDNDIFTWQETKYRQVEKTKQTTCYKWETKYRTVTKYREVEKTKAETRYKSLFESLFGI